MQAPTTKRLGESLKPIISKLVTLSKADKHDVFNDIQWPDALPEDQFWMSEKLLSVFGTAYYDEIGTEDLYRLSKEECLNFFSLNVHGIRELLSVVVKHLHTPGFEIVSEFFHHFVDEENEHMYFFAKFCLQYGGKMYSDKRIQFPSAGSDSEINLFLVFLRMWLFEEIVDHFNYKMSTDKSLHPFIQELNMLHHKDEARHIAFGSCLLESIFRELVETRSPEDIEALRTYTKGYIKNSIELLYNPYVYQTVGLKDNYTMRSNLLENEYRKQVHFTILSKPLNKLVDYNILLNKNFYE